MKLSIDTEWYDVNKCLPPMDEEVLCAVKSGDCVGRINEEFKYELCVRIYLGSRDRYGWYINGKYQKKQHYHKHDVLYWTWLPKLPEGWIINDLVD